MMTETYVWAGALVVVTAMVCVAVLRGWRGWLDLRRLELSDHDNATTPGEVRLVPAVRIELADMKERLRKLEAIARGVDL